MGTEKSGETGRRHREDIVAFSFMNTRRTTGRPVAFGRLTPWIVDIGQSKSRFTEGGAPLFRKRQNWFVQFSPLYNRGLAGREWTQKEERERQREREVHPAHREGNHCDGHFFVLVQSTGRHCPRHHRYFFRPRVSRVPSLPVRFIVIVIVIVTRIPRSRSKNIFERSGRGRGRGRMDGKGWKEFEAPSKTVVTPLFTLSTLEPECNSNSVNSGDFSKFH